MAQFLKHIGKVGDRKVAVVFRQVPGEEHMCLVVYTELLNQNIHDPLIACIESNIGQNSENLGEALNRSYTRDGKIILQVLHFEGMMKKVQTSQVLMTPAPKQHIKLNELNDLLNEMEKGEEAVKRLAELDRSRGLQDPADVARRMRGESTDPLERAKANQTSNAAFSDHDLARQRMEQAEKMEREANGLMAESNRLKNEAYSMDPSLSPKSSSKSSGVRKTTSSKTATTVRKTPTSSKSVKTSKTDDVVNETSIKRTGRPRKETVTG